MINVLLAGESWISQSTHFKGFDSFTSVTFHSGAIDYIASLDEEIEVKHLFAHDVPQYFPDDLESLNQYDVVVLSDIGANSFLLPPESWLNGKSSPNRLKNLRDWVASGGGLMMAGGYLSFQGFQARANFARSPIADVFPILMSDYDDRIEIPEGAVPNLVDIDHPIGKAWPLGAPSLLGYNKVAERPEAQVIARVNGDVLIATGEYGEGRTLVWTSDIGPHWCPKAFVEWPGYQTLMSSMIKWLHHEI